MNIFPSRQPLLQGLPMEQMETCDMIPEGMEFDPVLCRVKFAEENRPNRPLPVGDELEIQRKNLWAAIAEYEKTSKTEFTARWESEDGVGKLDWHQMLDDVDQTVRRYEQAAETSRGDSKRSRCYAAVR